jgi:hypothetical protein
MKTIIVTVLMAILFAGTANAQKENDYSGEFQSFFMPYSQITGWFFELNSSASNLNSKYTRLPGIAGGVMMNNSMYVGLRAKSFSWHETYLDFNNVLSEECYLNGGYAGLYLESGIQANKLIHLTIPVTIGGGAASYMSKALYPEIEDEFEIDFSRKELSASPFLVFEPGINLEMNVTGFLKLAAGYSYRWLYGLRLENTRSNAFNAGSINVGLRLGRF